MDHVAIVNRVIGSYSKATSQMQMQLDQRPHIGDASESQKGVFYLGSPAGTGTSLRRVLFLEPVQHFMPVVDYCLAASGLKDGL